MDRGGIPKSILFLLRVWPGVDMFQGQPYNSDAAFGMVDEKRARS
jgi:hypothetical protein